MPRTNGKALSWVVVQNGAWLGYQIPAALAEAGVLEAVATDWYSPLDRPWGRAALRVLPSGTTDLLRRRYVPAIPSRRVRSSPMEAVRLRFGGTQEAADARLGERGGRLAARRHAGVFSFSYYAYTAFRASEPELPRLIHQVHPHPASLRAVFSEELRRVPDAHESLSREHEMTAAVERLEQLGSEAGMADCCIAASEYTRRTVVENGVDEDRVRVIPYGVDLESYRPPAEPPSETFRVLFVGQLIQRKGLSYLIDAWNALGLRDAELVLAGRGALDPALMRRCDESIRIEPNVSRDRLRALYQTSDIFCMPSLAEGFGLVYLESLACGTPVIGTHNTAVADIVTDGCEGFTVPIRDSDAIADRLRWAHDNRDALGAMRANARALAEQFTWDRFRRDVASLAREVGDRWPRVAR